MRLIDADALKKRLSRLEASGGHKYYRKGMDDTLHYHMPHIIDEAPTVDVEKVIHGKWITEKCDHVSWRIKNPEKWVIYKCSVCGYSNGRKHSNYCPNCGAKMDEGKGE